MVRGAGRALRALAKEASGSARRSREEQEEEWIRGEQGPRSFPQAVKDACWERAEVVSGRDPSRWRRDALGNVVFRKLVGCKGCLCHDFDHVVPYSKGGPSTLENCQVLQASANRAKGNRIDVSTTELVQQSAYCKLAARDMDMVELSAYGDVHHESTGGCKIQ